ncbi:MAG: hypothetical protein ABI391_04980 [Hyphomicrobiaceae bacterium]
MRVGPKKERLEQRLLQPFHADVFEHQRRGTMLNRSTAVMLDSMIDATYGHMSAAITMAVVSLVGPMHWQNSDADHLDRLR